MDQDARPVLTEGPQGLSISLGGRVLDSGSSHAEKRVRDALSASQTLYIVLSPLLFKGVDILSDLIDEESFILAVESNADLFELTEEFLPEDRTNISYIDLSGGAAASDIIESLGPHRFRRVVPVRLNAGYMLDRARYGSFAKEAESFLQSFWKNRMTTIHMGRLWCRNIFLNLGHLSEGLPISALGTDKAVLAAGAGESLDCSIPFIKEHRDRFFIVAADTAVSTLLDSGIRADLVIVLESQHANLYDFYRPGALDLPAAFDLTSSPELIRKHRGDKYFFISHFDDINLLSRMREAGLLPPVIPPLGSVGIAAVYLALCIGRGAVFHTGLDFSFIPDKYHSKGSPSHLILLEREGRTLKPGFFPAALPAGGGSAETINPAE